MCTCYDITALVSVMKCFSDHLPGIEMRANEISIEFKFRLKIFSGMGTRRKPQPNTTNHRWCATSATMGGGNCLNIFQNINFTSGQLVNYTDINDNVGLYAIRHTCICKHPEYNCKTSNLSSSRKFNGELNWSKHFSVDKIKAVSVTTQGKNVQRIVSWLLSSLYNDISKYYKSEARWYNQRHSMRIQSFWTSSLKRS